MQYFVIIFPVLRIVFYKKFTNYIDREYTYYYNSKNACFRQGGVGFMGTQRYVCNECSEEFNVSYLWSKPKAVSCPKCGSQKVAEVLKSCGCSRKADPRIHFT